jgi:hypothetical protein
MAGHSAGITRSSTNTKRARVAARVTRAAD